MLTRVFEDTVPPAAGVGSVTTLANAASASIVGPKLLGAHVHGVGNLQSLTSACQPPWCSTMELTVDDTARLWTLDELELFAEGDVSEDVIGPIGGNMVAIRRVRIEQNI